MSSIFLSDITFPFVLHSGLLMYNIQKTVTGSTNRTEGSAIIINSQRDLWYIYGTRQKEKKEKQKTER